jgi:hypothetical protein
MLDIELIRFCSCRFVELTNAGVMFTPSVEIDAATLGRYIRPWPPLYFTAWWREIRAAVLTAYSPVPDPADVSAVFQLRPVGLVQSVAMDPVM